jgi:outer membrane lipoprotein-sorting protein
LEEIMNAIKRIAFASTAALLAFFTTVSVAQAQALSAEEIAAKAQKAFYYAGKDIKAKVLMKLISKNGKERTRELTMLRLNKGDKGEQKYYMYFHRPADVRGMSFMVWKYTGKDDDRWLYIPAIKLVKRIAADDKNSSFVGSDFSYEDISGRDLKDDTHTLKGEESVNGKAVYVLESVPREPKSAYYSRKVAWIDKETFLPLKEEYYDKRGKLYKTFTAEEIETIQGIATIMKRTMANVQNGHRTEVTFSEVKYNVGLRENLFSERYLRSAPREWIR